MLADRCVHAVSVLLLHKGRPVSPLRGDYSLPGRILHKPSNSGLQLFQALAGMFFQEDKPVGEPVHIGPVFKRVGDKEAAVGFGFGPFVGKQWFPKPLDFPGSDNVQQRGQTF